MKRGLKLGVNVTAKSESHKSDLCCIDIVSDLNERVTYGSLRHIVYNARAVFQFIEWENIRLAGEALVYLLYSKSPPMSAPLWSLHALESVYRNIHTFPIWRARNCPFYQFIALFPRTFDLIGARLVRLRRFETRTVLDSRDEVMRNCAHVMLSATPPPSFMMMVLGDY